MRTITLIKFDCPKICPKKFGKLIWSLDISGIYPHLPAWEGWLYENQFPGSP